MRQEVLTTVKGGLNRLRTKGAALKDSAYDLLNGYVTSEKTVKVRPGTILEDTLTTGTVGLVAFENKFHVFSHTAVAGLPSDYELHVLHGPSGTTLSTIHFAEPFLGVLYVVAEFSDGTIYHYWLRDASTWAQDTVYEANQIVQPTSVNGFVYRATRLELANPLWAPNIDRAVNDKVEPTTPNNYYFEVTQVFGSSPASSDAEPAWADPEEGELFIENTDGGSAATPPTPAPPVGDRVVPTEIDNRYRRLGNRGELP